MTELTLASALLGFFVWVNVLLERKLGARLQARIGMNRVGRGGVLFWLADAVKLATKSGQTIPRRTRLWLTVWSGAQTAAIASLPWTASSLALHSEMLPMVLPLIMMVAVLAHQQILGRGTETRGRLLYNRELGQAIAFAPTIFLAVLCAGVSAKGFSWGDHLQQQGAFPPQWRAFSGPFEFLAMIVAVLGTSGMLSVGVFQTSQPSGDLGSGIASLVLRVGTKISKLLLCSYVVFVFFGGWRLPHFLESALQELGESAHASVSICWVLIKAAVLGILQGWIARIHPRSHAEDISGLAWAFLMPVGLIALVGTVFFHGGSQ